MCFVRELIYFHQNMQKVQEVTEISDVHIYASILKSDNYVIAVLEEYCMFFTVQQYEF